MSPQAEDMLNRRQERKEPDWLKATVISLFPEGINEPKPGLYPGYFIIPPAALGDFSWLVVGDAIFFAQNKNDQMLTIKTPFHVVAESIVRDFQECHIGRVVGDNIFNIVDLEEDKAAEPGLFWVPGGYESKRDILADPKVTRLISIVEARQLRWFEQLVMIADDTFSRTGRNTSVSKLQRQAARRLNLQRPWLIDATGTDKCPFCKQPLPFGASKCPSCREVIDRAAYEASVAANMGNVQEVNSSNAPSSK